MKQDKKGKVALAMSGGVDSGMVAALMVKAGYQAAGFHMKLWQEDISQRSDLVPPEGGTKQRRNFGASFRRSDLFQRGQFRNKCCDLESLEAARKTAHQLGIPFYVIDFEKVFKKRVVDYFLEEYAAGRTPNPCVRCNKFIKFGELLEYVRKLGYDYLATGHYARIVDEEWVVGCGSRMSYGDGGEIKSQNPPSPSQPDSQLITHNSSYHLLMAKDKLKDQSYFLYNLTQSQLTHVLFPVGDYLKKQVVAMAKKWRLPVAERPESQEICFFPENDYRPFLRRQIPGKIVPGEVVNMKGGVIGKHKGLPLYTIGQRHGFEIRAKHLRGGPFDSAQGKLPSSDGEAVIPPFYVIAKDVKKNQLVVGFGKETERKEFWVRKVSWIDPLTIKQLNNRTIRTFVRIRHQGKLLPARLFPKVSREFHLRGGTATPPRVKVVLEEAERGIAPGQAAVFYREVQRCKGTKVQRKNTLHPCNSVPLYLSHEVLGGGIISD